MRCIETPGELCVLDCTRTCKKAAEKQEENRRQQEEADRRRRRQEDDDAAAAALLNNMAAALTSRLWKKETHVNKAWQPISTAPKDGTLVLLLIGPYDRENPLEDTARGSRTIGQNNLKNDGEDKWLFAGWDWEQDEYVQGEGTPVAWQLLPPV